jgi:hypothetical protein
VSILGASSPVVDWTKLGDVVLYSLGAGVGVALCFSLAVLGATRLAEVRGSPRVAYGVLAVLGLAATVGAVVAGIVVMTSK